MAIREVLQRVLTEYSQSKSQPLEDNPLARYIRRDAKSAVEEALAELGPGLLVEGSPGQGNWAGVPWVAVFDPTVTNSATRGFYVVYLFHATKSIVYLSLNQGATAVRKEFKSRGLKVLRQRADLIRKRVPEFLKKFSTTEIDLGSKARLPAGYMAGHALGLSYELGSLPSTEALQSDLRKIVEAYRALIFRNTEGDEDDELNIEFGLSNKITITEKRQYAFHRKIERNSTASRKAKKYHGTTCQACTLNFGERYGKIGKGFIEAHHLKPIGKLKEGEKVEYNIASDFAVLCANCHRMIHRSDDPSDLSKFRLAIASNKS
jgi:5-methylcytosine-specific restriction protein A